MSSAACRLSVNLNKAALLRNSRGGGRPDVSELARLAIGLGVRSLTLHPRADERHATLRDVFDLMKIPELRSGEVELNVEGDPREDLLRASEDASVHQFTLVPVQQGEKTTTRGWSDQDDLNALRRVVDRLRGRMRVSIFVEPEPEPIFIAANLKAHAVELNTTAYAASAGDVDAQLVRLSAASRLARQHGLRVHAGHDLDLVNLPALVRAVAPDEVSIGHALICDAVCAGFSDVVRSYLEAVLPPDSGEVLRE